MVYISYGPIIIIDPWILFCSYLLGARFIGGKVYAEFPLQQCHAPILSLHPYGLARCDTISTYMESLVPLDFIDLYGYSRFSHFPGFPNFLESYYLIILWSANQTLFLRLRWADSYFFWSLLYGFFRSGMGNYFPRTDLELHTFDCGLNLISLS